MLDKETMKRSVLCRMTLVLGLAVLSAKPLRASNPQMRIQVLDEDSGSSIEQVTVTSYSIGANPEVRVRTTDGKGIANFGRLMGEDSQISACRPDYIPSEPKLWSELAEGDQLRTRVLKLKRSTTRRPCIHADQTHRRRAGGSGARSR